MSQSEAHSHENVVGHVVPLKLLFGILGTLLFLTFVTVAITWFDLGPFNLIAAMAIAVVKGSLVCLYFMHLRWDRPFNSFVLIISLVFLAVFICFVMLDSFAYQPDLIPDYAPELQR
ncbi:MAG: cytochrome C oxidase subunit IV family protein [Acidobacteriota bacterium]|nr:cytochrome C oxidase subunit IV family protein [Acidobacteriota bacterium]MDH3784044.1 cytochrome C oxidase subunit IV family protein [Acidobacteriota bacterium]